MKTCVFRATGQHSPATVCSGAHLCQAEGRWEFLPYVYDTCTCPLRSDWAVIRSTNWSRLDGMTIGGCISVCRLHRSGQDVVDDERVYRFRMQSDRKRPLPLV